MTTEENRRLAEAAWTMLEKQDWDGLMELFSDDFVQEWPQSGERLLGKEKCIEVNRTYPGGLPQSEVRNVRADGNLATTEVALTYPDGSSWRGISIFEFRDGKITKEIDYFAQPFEAPAWRAHLVEKM